MKTSTIFLVAFLISINAFSQPDVKGFKVGTSLKPTIVSIVGNLYKIRSGDTKFEDKFYEYVIVGLSSEKNGQSRSVSETEIQNLVSGFEKKYNIKFSFAGNSSERSWSITKGEYQYNITENYYKEVKFFISNNIKFNEYIEITIRARDLYNKNLQNEL